MKTSILFLLLLVCMVVTRSIDRFSFSSGIDFYHYWGICNAQQWSSVPLGNPYADQARYAAVLNAHADRSQDGRLKAANEARRTLDPTGTPLLYAAFSFLPSNYSLAYAVFQAIQILMFVLAVVMLGWLYRCDRLWVWLIALLLAGMYEPLASDFRVGNVNSIQLFALAALLVLVERISANGSAGIQFLRCAVLVFAMAALSLMKPNLAPVTVLLSACLWGRYGTRTFAIAAVTAGAFCLALAAVPCLSFHSWTIWQDWYHMVFGCGQDKLIQRAAGGNYAAAVVVSEALEIPYLAAGIGLAVAMTVPVIAALSRADTGVQSRLQSLWNAAVCAIQNPHLMAAAAIVTSLALAPLVWVHYYTLSLLPAFWFLWSQHRWSRASAMGALSLLLTTFPMIFARLGYGDIMRYTYPISLIPLWIGVVAEIALPKQSQPEAVRNQLL
jgi:hypothetical protein